MKKVYFDQTEATACMSVIVRDAQVIPAGATVSSMPVRHKNSEYQRYGDEYDIQFIFDDNVPQIDFYTIPQIDIFATDSKGGYIASLGQNVDLDSDAPICYIDIDRKCFVVAPNGREFLNRVKQWKTLMTPCTDVEFFASREEASAKYEFLDREKIEQALSK